MMIRQRQSIAWVLLGALSQLIVGFGAQAEPPSRPSHYDGQGVVQLGALTDSDELLSVSGPPRGIRTYGTGAVRIDLPKTGGVASDASTPEDSGPEVDVSTKISGSPTAGSVSAFRVSPNGQTAVYIADQVTAGRFELYSTPVDGSATPTKISDGLPFGTGDEGVSAFQITPDGTTVVFTADPALGGGSDDIFSVPIDGSASPLQLNAGTEAPVLAFGLDPNNSIVGFFGSTTELFVATIGVASSAIQVSNVGQTVVFADFSPNSSWMVYAADGQWYSVPSDGTGSPVQISNALSTIGAMAVTPNSSRVVYTSDDNVVGVLALFSKQIGGGGKIQHNPALAGSGVVAIAVSPDGNRVTYLADQDTDGVIEVYSALMNVSVSGTRVNTPMGDTQAARTLNVTSDSTTVVYEADQDTVGTIELYAAPIDAGSGPTTLHGLTPPDNAGFLIGQGTPIIGLRAVYTVIGDSNIRDLFSVQCDGNTPYAQINDPVESGDNVVSVFPPRFATRLMAYGVGPADATVTAEVHAVPVRGDLPSQQINVTAGAGELGALDYEITADEHYGVYLQDQDTDGKPELYSAALDSDADTVVNALDNCTYVANSSQGSVVFGPTVLAASKSSFTWGDPTELRFVRGPLSGVDVYATDDSGTLTDAASYTDAETPATGSGWYYLFAPDCSVRSYQTVLGEQPDRDLAAFP
jgi:Tol biopolymer transport system component